MAFAPWTAAVVIGSLALAVANVAPPWSLGSLLASAIQVLALAAAFWAGRLS